MPIILPNPCKQEVLRYLQKWNEMENYRLQEEALDKLFLSLAPENKNISDILIKASALNDFYSTNIYSIFTVAKHIHSLHIDKRLQGGDVSLVPEMQRVVVGGKEKNFYSFSTKYCSHHNPDAFPMYDSYVDKMLIYFRDREDTKFASFANKELKDYTRFKAVLERFREYFGLQEFTLKQIDKYLWQLGKEYFPNKY